MLQGNIGVHSLSDSRLAQTAERKALNLVVVGSSPTVGASQCAHVVGVLIVSSFVAIFSVLQKWQLWGLNPRSFRECRSPLP